MHTCSKLLDRSLDFFGFGSRFLSFDPQHRQVSNSRIHFHRSSVGEGQTCKSKLRYKKVCWQLSIEMIFFIVCLLFERLASDAPPQRTIRWQNYEVKLSIYSSVNCYSGLRNFQTSFHQPSCERHARLSQFHFSIERCQFCRQKFDTGQSN